MKMLLMKGAKDNHYKQPDIIQAPSSNNNKKNKGRFSLGGLFRKVSKSKKNGDQGRSLESESLGSDQLNFRSSFGAEDFRPNASALMSVDNAKEELENVPRVLICENNDPLEVGPPRVAASNRYLSLISKCISLQNSDMTSMNYSEMSDKESRNEDRSISEGKGSSASSQDGEFLPVLLKSGSENSPKACLTRVDTNSALTTIYQTSDKGEECIPNKEYERSNLELYENEDVAAYLSEAESDTEFNSHEEESGNEYKRNGYHPVMKGEQYYSNELQQREYIILRKLGWGHFSTVWLAKSRYNENLSKRDNKDSKTEKIDKSEYYVAIKFVKSGVKYTTAAEDEISLMKALDLPCTYAKYLDDRQGAYLKRFEDAETEKPTGHPGYDRVMKLLDVFYVEGPNGRHIGMVFEVLGENVLNFLYRFKNLNKGNERNKSSSQQLGSAASSGPPPSIESKSHEKLLESQSNRLPATWINATNNLKQYKGGLPLVIVKQVVKQMFLAVDYMHHCGIIHTDLKPENILLEIKNVHHIIRRLEKQKVLKFYEKHGVPTRIKYPDYKINEKSSKKKGEKHHKTNEIYSQFNQGTGFYRKSRIPTKSDMPVRASKPLSVWLTDSSSLIKKHDSNDISEQRMNNNPDVDKNKEQLNMKELANDDMYVSIKVADFGNATFAHHHFTNQIQTRQYRAPEIILQHRKWGASADIWSLGCIIFELITGDYLFDPRSGSSFTKDDDHLALIVELAGEFPPESFLENCKLRDNFMYKDDDGKYHMKKIPELKYWSLFDVLVEKYHFQKDDPDVYLMADLISKCLIYNLDERYDSKALALHPWLNDGNMDSLEHYNSLPHDHDDIPGFTS